MSRKEDELKDYARALAEHKVLFKITDTLCGVTYTILEEVDE